VHQEQITSENVKKHNWHHYWYFVTNTATTAYLHSWRNFWGSGWLGNGCISLSDSSQIKWPFLITADNTNSFNIIMFL